MNEKKDVSVVAALDPNTQNQLRKQLDDLTAEFASIFSRETVERFVDESTEALAGARLHDYVPVLVHRFARERLRALGQAEGVIAKEIPEVLFVCVHSAGRSRMAAALLNHRAAGRVHVRSCGSDPADELNPMLAPALSELGVDVSREFPKPMTDEVVRAADAVITMGCGDACPIYPGKIYEDWEVEDPAGENIERVREIREDIDRRVQGLLARLVEDRTGSSA